MPLSGGIEWKRIDGRSMAMYLYTITTLRREYESKSVIHASLLIEPWSETGRRDHVLLSTRVRKFILLCKRKKLITKKKLKIFPLIFYILNAT